MRIVYIKPGILCFPLCPSVFSLPLLPSSSLSSSSPHPHPHHLRGLRRSLSSRGCPPLFWHHPVRPAGGSPCSLTPLQSCWLFFFVAPSGNIRFLPEIGINSAVKAPVNIPVSWAWPCHLSLGTASLLFSTLPSGCSRWFHCARHSGRRNQSPGQEHVCIELEGHRAESALQVLSASLLTPSLLC